MFNNSQEATVKKISLVVMVAVLLVAGAVSAQGYIGEGACVQANVVTFPVVAGRQVAVLIDTFGVIAGGANFSYKVDWANAVDRNGVSQGPVQGTASASQLRACTAISY